MPHPPTLKMVVLLVIVMGGCESAPKQNVLSAPPSTLPAATRHNNEGIEAYQQKQWAEAKRHFEAAIQVSPDLAEGHYNLGVTLYRLGEIREGDVHFMKAANLAPGDRVIWNSPPLQKAAPQDKAATLGNGNRVMWENSSMKGTAPGDKEMTKPGSDGHAH